MMATNLVAVYFEENTMKIKTIILSSLLLLSTQVFADNITVSNPDEVDFGNNKTECIYHNGADTYSYVTTGECKYSATFNSGDAE